MKIYLVLLVSLLLTYTKTPAQMVIDLYSTIPNAKPCNTKETYSRDAIERVANVTHPSLQVFLPKLPNKAASSVLICPGGGYSILAIDHEGIQVAKALNELGI